MAAIEVVLILMILGAIVAIEVKDLLSSVIALGVVGLGFALICLLVSAPDVAITQLVVEILAVIILIRATLRRDLPRPTTGRGFWTACAAVAFLAALVGVSAAVFDSFPPFGEPIMRVSGPYVEGAVEDTGATNVVAAILLDYRAYDTLGEATVLFTAAIGVLAVSRKIGRKEAEPRLEQVDE